MKNALEHAKRAKKRGDLPFGSVVVYKDKIISFGECFEFTKNNVVFHAEMQAVSQACEKLGRDLSNCELYTTCEPCTMCASAIFQAKIKKIFIGASRDDISGFFRSRKIRFANLALDLSYVPQIELGLMENEVLALFKDLKKKD